MSVTDAHFRLSRRIMNDSLLFAVRSPPVDAATAGDSAAGTPDDGLDN